MNKQKMEQEQQKNGRKAREGELSVRLRMKTMCVF